MLNYKGIRYFLVLLWGFPILGYCQSQESPANGPNFIKYELLGAITGNSLLNATYERFLFKRAVSLEIGIAQLSTGSLEYLPPSGKRYETDTNFGECYSTTRGSHFYSKEYNCKGYTFRLGPKIFPLNLGNKRDTYLRRGFYFQPDFYLNLYKTEYYLQENDFISCTEWSWLFPFGSTTEYEVTSTFFEDKSAYSFVGKVNVGYQITFPIGIHLDFSFGLGTPLLFSNPSRYSLYRNPVSRIEVGYSF